METVLPDIEDHVPLPKNAADALPALSPHDELAMHARTIKLLADLNGTPIEPSAAHVADAERLAREMINDPSKKLDLVKYPNETVAYLAGLVAQVNGNIVDELSELKSYVVNRLVYEIEHSKDSRTRIAALTKLGEVDGVDAFKKRTETTIQIKTLEQVEKELNALIEGVEYKVIEEQNH